MIIRIVVRKDLEVLWNTPEQRSRSMTDDQIIELIHEDTEGFLENATFEVLRLNDYAKGGYGP